MSMTQMADLRKLSRAELIKRLKELKTELDQFYTLPKEKLEKIAGSKRKFKLEYARIKTILN